MYKTTTPDISLAQAKEKRIVKFGLDVHADQITVCRMQEGSLPQPAQKMSPQKALSWIIGHVEDGFEVHSCYEAGPCGFWLHRALTARGVVNVVVAPQRWDAQGKRVKTDKRDARELADRLERYLRGNRTVFSLVRVPTPQQEQRRSLARQRGALMKERNRCILRGRSMMLLEGTRACGTIWWRRSGAWNAGSRNIHLLGCWSAPAGTAAENVRRWPWPGGWRSICGGSPPGNARRRSSGSNWSPPALRLWARKIGALRRGWNAFVATAGRLAQS